MASYAGAVAAIKQRMIDNWKTGDDPKTPIVLQNAASEYDPGSNASQPWVYFEVITDFSEIIGAGTPGSQSWLYHGHIFGHVLVPINTGTELADQYAVDIGEIFRAEGFYNDGQGSILRTWSPWTDGGGSDADDGNWWRVTCTIPFEFYYRG